VTAGIGVGIVSVLVVLVIMNAGWILSFLSTNALVRQEGIRYIYISMISEPFMALGTILGGGLTASGDTRSLLLRVALSLWLVRIPLSYACVVHFGFGPAAVWWAMNLSQGVSAFLIAQRYLGRKLM
jgi:MATE family multidrug resistance protein